MWITKHTTFFSPKVRNPGSLVLCNIDHNPVHKAISASVSPPVNRVQGKEPVESFQLFCQGRKKKKKGPQIVAIRSFQEDLGIFHGDGIERTEGTFQGEVEEMVSPGQMEPKLA